MFFNAENVMASIRLLQAEEFMPFSLETAGDVLDRLTIIKQYLKLLPIIHFLKRQLGLDKVCRATDATEIYSLHGITPLILKFQLELQ